MKKSIHITLLTLIISSCNVQESPNIIETKKVNWSNEKLCSVSVDEKFINNLVQKMTLEQKVGQVIMPDIDEVTPQDAKKYQLGTFLNGGGKFPNKNKNSSVADWKVLSRDFYN